MSVLKRKYNEEVPDSAKYKVPQASIPSRRTQIKITPDGKTGFGPNEIIRIMIPPQGYFDPEYSYLSFDVQLKCPSSYMLKALEVWNSGSTAFLYDVGLGGIIAVGKGGAFTSANAGIQLQCGSTNVWGGVNRSRAQCIPFIRYKQAIDFNTAVEGNQQRVFSKDVLFEWIPVGHIYPVLPFASHGFFNRVVLRTANNTPIEDIQDYDYLCALMGQLMQSEGYVSTMGSMLEGWGGIRERAKLGLSCVAGLKYLEPNLKGDRNASNFSDQFDLFTDGWGYSSGDSSFTEVTSPASLQTISGLSPEGVKNASLKETVGGVKLTCNLNLGMLQQKQNLPLLFSGGLILELYTAPFERCMSFATIFSRIDATDMPNVFGGQEIGGPAELVDVTAMDCCLPLKLTKALGITAEVDETTTNTGLRKVGRPLADNNCFYYKSGVTDTANETGGDTKEKASRSSCAFQHFLTAQLGSPGQAYLVAAGKRTLYQYATTDDTITAYPYATSDYTTKVSDLTTTSVTSDTKAHVQSNDTALKLRYTNSKWMSVGGSDGWSYTLANVELRADMVQFSQAYDESVAAIVDSDEGLPITFQTFSVQKLLYNGQRSTLTMNERARSIQFAMAIFKDPEMERQTHVLYTDNDSRYYCFGDFNVPIGFSAYAAAMHTATLYSNDNTSPPANQSFGWSEGQPWSTHYNHYLKSINYTTVAPTFNQTPFTATPSTEFTPISGNALQCDGFGLEMMTVPSLALGLCTTASGASNVAQTNLLTAYRSTPHTNARWAGSHVWGPQISCASMTQKYVAVSNPWRSFMRVIPQDAQSVSINPDLRDYQFRIGTRFIPASPVDCSSGAVQAYIELMKAIGMYGSFSGDGKRALLPGIRLTPDLYSKRICTRDSPLLAAAYGYYLTDTTKVREFNAGITGTLDCMNYVGQRYRVPTRFVLGQNFSDIPDHATGVDTATQALAVELALNGEMSPAKDMNVYVFLNVRRDLFIRCGGQIEILY